jgi:hypothetical protein
MLNLARMYLFHHRRQPGANTPLFANVGTRTSRRYYCSVETRNLPVALRTCLWLVSGAYNYLIVLPVVITSGAVADRLLRKVPPS